VTVGNIIHAAFEGGGRYTWKELEAWKEIFSSQTPFEKFEEVGSTLWW